MLDIQDPTTIFSYGWEQRLQCVDCKKVRYRVEEADVVSVSVPAMEKGKTEDGKTIYEDVELTKCLESLLGVEALEYTCPNCKRTVHALKWVQLPLSYRAVADILILILQTNEVCSIPRNTRRPREEIPTRQLGPSETGYPDPAPIKRHPGVYGEAPWEGVTA